MTDVDVVYNPNQWCICNVCISESNITHSLAALALKVVSEIRRYLIIHDINAGARNCKMADRNTQQNFRCAAFVTNSNAHEVTGGYNELAIHSACSQDNSSTRNPHAVQTA